MVKFLIQRPIAVFMASLALLLLGLVATQRIPISLMPNIAIPEITVQVSYPNNTAKELETNVVRPLRNQLLQVSNLKDVVSETRDGYATLKLLFNHGTNTDFAFIETNEKVDVSLNYLPRDIDRPKVIKATATDIPILNICVSLKGDYSDESFLELSRFTETVLKKRIEQLPEIALADLSGQTQAEILVTPYKEKLKSLGIDTNELTNAIKQNNFELGNLMIQNGIYQYNFKFANPLHSKEDIEDIYLNIHNKLFKIKDLAKVNVSPQQDKGLVYNNGKRALVLSIIKQADARVYELKETLDKLTASFIKDYPNLEFTSNQDQTKLLKLSIDNLKSSLWIGSLLAILIMFFFLRDLKSPLIIAVSIPTSLLLSMLFMYLFGLSINIISLSGLILGVGMMIDNAIIVIDNITQKITAGETLNQACIKGTNEIITPLISSVLTTISVFVPLLFLSGMTGALFYDQAVTVSIGLGASLVVSIILIPVLFKQIKSKTFKIEQWLKLKNKSKKIDSLYEKGFHFFFQKKWIIYSIAIISIAIGALLFKTMSYTKLPHFKQDEAILLIDWNENINVHENQKRISSLLDNISNIETSFSQIGEQQFLLQRKNLKSLSEADIYLKANSILHLTAIKKQISNNLKTHYPKAVFRIEQPKNIFQYLFGNTKNNLSAQVFSRNTLEVPSVDDLDKINVLLATKTNTKIPLKQTAFIQILHENVLLYDVSYTNLINELKTSFNQNFIDNLKTAQNFIPIKLNYNLISLQKEINQLFVRNKNNKLIPIRQLITINTVQQYKTINANRKGTFLTYNIATKNNETEQIKAIKNTFVNQPEYNVRFDGNFQDMITLKKELIFVGILAILLLYFIMAAQFESLWQPIIILLEIPIDIGGALLLLWLFGGTINVMATIGIIVMSGIIINDSILKIHTINLLRNKGYTILEAIKLGGKLRLKPIIMTSITTILALTPFLFMNSLGATLQKPLALTIIGGMFIGTLISLYLIPLLYYTFSKKDN